MVNINTDINDSISIGNRVKSARMLSGHSRTAFAKKSKISADTLRVWEEPNRGNGKRYGLTQKGAQRLVHALSLCNIECSIEWLLFGTGFGPSITGCPMKPLDFDFEKIYWGEEESILKDIASFKMNNQNSIITMITDDLMFPFFSSGDYVGGCFEANLNTEKLISTNCIIDTGDDVIVRKILSCHENLHTVTSVNPSLSAPMISSVQIKNVAEIVWHRWRKKS